MPLDPGDILFVGWDSDNNDIQFIATTDIDPGEVIYFTDDERDASGFFGTEQLMEWTVPAGGITQGSIITIDMDPGSNTTTIDAGGGFDYIRGGHQLAGGNEMFWAFQGTRVGDDVTPTNFIAVIANEADGTDRQTPNLTGTGLTTSNGALIIDGDEDYMEWTADGGLSDPVQRQDLIDSILDTSNWTTADGAGNNNPNGTGFDVDPPRIVCFASQTRICVGTGSWRPAGALVAGDRIPTLSGRLRTLRWVGRKSFRRADLDANPKLRPVRISAGALGAGLPERDLLVSRQHRLLVSSQIANRMFGTTDVLVPAIRLTALPGIFVDHDVTQITYVHLLFDAHEVIFAEGAPAESLLTGSEALESLDEDALAEIAKIFPDMVTRGDRPQTALLIPGNRLQKRLISRHVKNQRSLLLQDRFRH